jgi:dTDP-6-deoxy-L-talose 4-dehydrogenase (NAD+)
LTDFPNHFLFLKNLADHGTHQFAIAGSFREYGAVNGMVDEHRPVKPDNYYTLAKLMLKQALEICFAGKGICLQWLRPFTVYGDDARNQSIFSKIMQWEAEGKTSFPFTDGSEQYDYISVDELAHQIAAIVGQTAVDGVIDCCSVNPIV